MADIKFSDSMVENGVLPNGIGTMANGGLRRTGSFPEFRLMMNAIPTQSELNAFTFDIRNADELVVWKTSTITNLTTTSITVGNVIGSSVLASASGLAEWFIWQGGNDTFGAFDHEHNNVMIVGTISLIGGGGDLEISDTTIVSGQAYEIGNTQLNFSATYVY